jgi:hypothetical protein
MKRVELEHIIRAAAGLTDEREFIIVGAAALLGSVPAPPAELAQTLEADIYPRRKPELAELIEGSMGELSLFHDTHRYYAHGVGPDTAKLPSGWETRLVAIQGTPTNGAVGYCLEPHDLAASKLVAGREKDTEFVRAMLRGRIVTGERLRERIALLPVPAEHRQRLASWTREIERER